MDARSWVEVMTLIAANASALPASAAATAAATVNLKIALIDFYLCMACGRAAGLPAARTGC
jgi:hypothetical protein